MKKLLILSTCLVALCAFGCSDDDDDDNGTGSGPIVVTPMGFVHGSIYLDPGTYEFVVDADFDDRSFAASAGIPIEPLFGVGTIQIVPAPGTLGLLGLGSLVAVHRQRQRCLPGVWDED